MKIYLTFVLLVHLGAREKPPNHKYWKMHCIIIPVSITVLSCHVLPNWREDEKHFASPIPVQIMLGLAGCRFASHLIGLREKQMFRGYILFLSRCMSIKHLMISGTSLYKYIYQVLILFSFYPIFITAIYIFLQKCKHNCTIFNCTD